MRLRTKFWPPGMTSVISAQPSGRVSGVARQLFSWQALGAALLGIMLARWTWVLFAPAGTAVPPASWEASGDAGRLFGTASVADAGAVSPVGNIKLIGVFAHRTQGFAVIQFDDKQIGVAQGEEFKPGMKLAETYPDHVMVEQGGVLRRVDLSGAATPGGTAEASAHGMQAPMASPPPPAFAPTAPRNADPSSPALALRPSADR